MGLEGPREEEACEASTSRIPARASSVDARLLLPRLARIDIQTMIKTARDNDDAAEILPEL